MNKLIPCCRAVNWGSPGPHFYLRAPRGSKRRNDVPSITWLGDRGAHTQMKAPGLAPQPLPSNVMLHWKSLEIWKGLLWEHFLTQEHLSLIARHGKGQGRSTFLFSVPRQLWHVLTFVFIRALSIPQKFCSFPPKHFLFQATIVSGLTLAAGIWRRLDVKTLTGLLPLGFLLL